MLAGITMLRSNRDKSAALEQTVLEHALGCQILDLYRQTIFGKTTKAEIDLKVFAALVRIAFRKEPTLWERERFLWLRIEPVHLRKLSIELRITEMRVVGLVEQCALAEGAENLEGAAAIAEIQGLAKRYRQEKTDLNEGRLRLFIPNRYTRKAIEAFLSSNGAIPETSFHRDHLVIRLGDLLLAAVGTAEQESSKFLQELAERAAAEMGQDTLRAFEQALGAQSVSDRAQQLGKALTERLVDHATGAAVAGLLGLIGGILTR
jgi:hypothetical protein